MPNLSKKSAIPQLFTLKQSRLLLYLLIITHSLAAIASLVNGLPLAYKLLALLSVISSAVFYWRDYKQFQPYHIRHSEASGWQLAKSKNDYQTMQILPTSVLTASLIVLHFRLKTRKKHSLVIIKDTLTMEAYRALLVDLKIFARQEND